jgi:peptidoglycan glycosyltransferase
MLDRRIRWLAAGFLVLFLILLAQINYLQVFAADKLKENAANSPRLLRQEYDVKRGEILASDGRSRLAYSRATKGTLKYLRVYPRKSLYAQITGYYSVIFGTSGLEARYNEYLSGSASELLPQRLVDEILGRTKTGASLVTTIDPKLQRAAARALRGVQGGLVAMDPNTGEILAMYSTPTFDPNPLASHDSKEVRKAWKELTEDKSRPLLARANQELFPPGSTFKVVTAAAALEGGTQPTSTFPNPHELDLPQTNNVLKNFGDSHCLGGASEITLAQAFQISCNVVFGEVGLRIGAKRLVGQTQRFGFDQQIDFDIPFSEGQIPSADQFEQDLPGVAYSAIGQQSVAANPLAMALVTSAIANRGVEMQPRLVREIRDTGGRLVKSFGPNELGRAISSGTARQLTDMMISVVEAGTGTAGQIPGVKVAGKTGTAQHPGGDPHAWFLSFAPADDPQIVVAVVVLNGGSLGSEATGGQVAAPIAKAVLEAALGR